MEQHHLSSPHGFWRHLYYVGSDIPDKDLLLCSTNTTMRHCTRLNQLSHGLIWAMDHILTHLWLSYMLLSLSGKFLPPTFAWISSPSSMPCTLRSWFLTPLHLGKTPSNVSLQCPVKSQHCSFHHLLFPSLCVSWFAKCPMDRIISTLISDISI